MSIDTSTGSSSSQPRRLDIQGLRGLAVLLVVLFHAGLPVTGGFTGVDVFFAISGFVITAMLLRELTSVGRINMWRFYARRVKRLGPALAVMVVAVAAVGTIVGPVATQQVGVRTGLFASLFSANAYLFNVHTGYFDPAASLNPFLNTWTLGVEEQFYIFFPTLLLVSWWVGRRSRGRQLAIVAVSVTTAVSFLLALEFSHSMGGNHQQFAFYGSPTRAWEFGAGALVALLATWVARTPEPVAWALGAVGLAAIGVGAFTIHGATTFPVTATMLPVVGTCAVLAAGTASSSGMDRLLSVRPAVWIGDLSYSWYLWHWPLIVFAAALWPGAGWAAPALAAISLLPAWLSYRYVENPIRLNRRIAGRAVVALAAICIAVPVAVCLSAEQTAKKLATSSTMKAFVTSQRLHVNNTNGCHSYTPLGQRTPRIASSCSWNVPEPRGLIVLIGDSNAGHFSEAVIRAANRAGFDMTIATASSCPFIDIRLKAPANPVSICRRFYQGSIKALSRMRPNLVIAASRADVYVNDTVYGIGSAGGGALSNSAAAKAQIWTRGLASTLRHLNNAGVPVVVAEPVPLQPVGFGSCAVIRILTQTCTSSAARSKVENERRLAVTAEHDAVASAPTAWTIDFTNKLCDADSCSKTQHRIPMYRDEHHLSVAGALTLTNDYSRAILSHARS